MRPKLPGDGTLGFPFAQEQLGPRCPGCGRMIDASGLRPGDRFKCAKCKKLMTHGPHLSDPQHAASWRAYRTGVLLVLVAGTIWCVTVGYEFGTQTGRWTLGFGGPLGVWLLVVGCLALAARTTQNTSVLVGVTAAMSGLALFFVERLGQHVGYDVAAWHQRFRAFHLWAPGLIAIGLVVLTAGLFVQGRRRSL